MAISSTWRPNPTNAAYTFGRRTTIVTGAGFTKIDFRTGAWMGNCPGLATGGHSGADAIARGVLRKVAIRFVPNSEDSATDAAADSLNYADEDPGAGGDAYVGTYSGGSFERLYNPRLERSYIWVRAVGGNIAVEIEIGFDVYDLA